MLLWKHGNHFLREDSHNKTHSLCCFWHMCVVGLLDLQTSDYMEWLRAPVPLHVNLASCCGTNSARRWQVVQCTTDFNPHRMCGRINSLFTRILFYTAGSRNGFQDGTSGVYSRHQNNSTISKLTYQNISIFESKIKKVWLHFSSVWKTQGFRQRLPEGAK